MQSSFNLEQMQTGQNQSNDFIRMQKKMRICHVVGLPLLAGSQRSMLNILQYVDKDRYDISVICKEEGQLTEVLREKGINVITVPTLDNRINPFLDLKTAFKIYWIFKREKFNIVHTHSTKPGFIGRLAAKMAGVPIIIHHVQGFGFHEFSGRLDTYFLSFLEKVAALISTKVIFVNNEERKWAVEKGIVSPKKAMTIYNGVNLVDFNKLSNNGILRKIARQHLDIALSDTNCRVVGFIGRLWEQKDPQIVIEVARILVKDHGLKNIIFLIVGDGYLREKMEESVNLYGMSENVLFLGWRDDVNQIYPALDVLLLPSLWEGLPCTILEAMALGIPTVASDIKGNREAVVQHETGFLIPPKCANLFASAIMQILSDKELAKDMGKKSRTRAEIFYNSEITSKEVIKLYETCLKEKGINLR